MRAPGPRPQRAPYSHALAMLSLKPRLAGRMTSRREVIRRPRPRAGVSSSRALSKVDRGVAWEGLQLVGAQHLWQCQVADVRVAHDGRLHDELSYDHTGVSKLRIALVVRGSASGPGYRRRMMLREWAGLAPI